MQDVVLMALMIFSFTEAATPGDSSDAMPALDLITSASYFEIDGEGQLGEKVDGTWGTIYTPGTITIQEGQVSRPVGDESISLEPGQETVSVGKSQLPHNTSFYPNFELPPVLSGNSPDQ